MEKEKTQIKELYEDMESIAKMNPNLYVVPKALIEQIYKKIIAVERAMINVRKSRDNWRRKYMENKR